MYVVELNFNDDTLSKFEIQEWINDIFSVLFPNINAKIKTRCKGNCEKKYIDEIKQLKQQIQNMKCCDNYFNQFDNYQCRNCKNKSNWSMK